MAIEGHGAPRALRLVAELEQPGRIVADSRAVVKGANRPGYLLAAPAIAPTTCAPT